jgi:hypothetical protein
MHPEEPEADWYLPAAQLVQAEAEPVEYLPEAQVEQELEPVTPMKVPALQPLQVAAVANEK